MEKPIDIKSFKDRRSADFLTGCYTRGYIFTTLSKALKEKIPFTLFSIDLNKFKNINDLQGHLVGDVVLQKIGNRLNKLKNEELVFARIGGDEFLGVYWGTGIEKINEIGKTINNSIEKKIVYDNFEYEITASIGIASFPKDGADLSDLLTLADFAMYHVKKNNIRNHFLITKELSQKMLRRQNIKRLLKTINYEKDLSLRFQPQFDIKSNQVVGVESIIQWNHETEGTIERDEFLIIAEEMGIIQYITKWLFLNSLSQIQQWNEKYSANLCMNINVSQSCMYHRIFFENVSAMVEQYAIKPHWLDISMNEHSMMYAPEYMKKLLTKIRRMGITVSIHDFGSGMISIGCIKDLFVDSIKIGESIITGCEENENKKKTLSGIIALADAMELKTSANGVKNAEQYQILKSLGCQIMQGSYCGESLTADIFEKKYLH